MEAFELSKTTYSGYSDSAETFKNESNDGVELVENSPIKCEVISSEDDDQQQIGNEEGISTSCQPFSELEIEPTDTNETDHDDYRKHNRQSIDSNFSVDQLSSFSPNISNVLITPVSPINIKREPSIEFNYSVPSTSTEYEHKQHDTYKRQSSTESSNVLAKRPKLNVSIVSNAEKQLTSPDSGMQFIMIHHGLICISLSFVEYLTNFNLKSYCMKANEPLIYIFQEK